MYKSFKEMPVWQEAMAIAEEVFRLTKDFPKKEDYGLTSQLRRAPLSISANIAEGFGRNHALDKMKFYHYARGSAMETENHLEYAKRVGYLEMTQDHSHILDTPEYSEATEPTQDQAIDWIEILSVLPAARTGVDATPGPQQ